MPRVVINMFVIIEGYKASIEFLIEAMAISPKTNIRVKEENV